MIMNNFSTIRTGRDVNIRADALINENISGKMIAYASALVVISAIIILFGMVMLYSASYHTDGTYYFTMQLIWLAASTIVGIATFCAGYKLLADYSVLLLFMLAVLLIVAFTCYEPINGAYRWLRFDLKVIKISIQPSELVKVIVPLYVGKYCADNFRNSVNMFGRHGAWNPIAVTAFMCALVFLGKDLGTTLLIFIVMAVMLFIAGLRLRYYLPAIPAAIAGFFAIKAFSPFRWDRLTSFLNPELYQQDTGYQLWLSILALGSGSWTGVGFMESRMKAAYLPERHTDFILSVIGEELGFVAMVGVIIAYLLFFYFALKISCNARSRQGLYTGFGIAVTIVFQALINIGVVSGALPTKGIPAPLLSYGGSSLLMFGIALGILLNIAADTVSPDFNQQMWSRFSSHFRKKK